MDLEIVVIDNLFKFLFGARYIGEGTTARCFLLRDGSVFKLFKNNDEKEKLFNAFEMFIHLNDLGKLNNFTYIGPEKIYVYKNQIIGYSYRYIAAKKIDKLDPYIFLNDIISSFPKVEEDTYFVSERSYFLGDVHERNVLYNGNFYIIDLEKQKYKKEYQGKPTDHFLQGNMQRFYHLIICNFLSKKGIGLKAIHFHNRDLDRLYYETIYKDYRMMEEFLGAFKEEIKRDNPTILEMRRLSKRIYYRAKDEPDYKR